MEKKNLEQVYASKINRGLKVIYVIFCLIAVIMLTITALENDFDSNWLFGALITWAVFEFIRRGFYYIVAGDIAPEKIQDGDELMK